MIQSYSHTFKFQTVDSKDADKINNNVLSIVEENAKKHYIQYLQYNNIDGDNILLRKVNIKVDRLYYLEIANISIDDEERRKRLFTVLGKRCFGRNDNKLDPYLMDINLNPTTIYDSFSKDKTIKTRPIQHELITHNINRYKASTYFFKDNYFVILKQTNISKIKTFKKTFLVQMDQINYNKLLDYKTNELQIEFIFNLIGKIYFKSKELEQRNMQELEFDTQTVIDEINNDSSIAKNNQLFLDEKLLNNLKGNFAELEKEYFRLLSTTKQLIESPNEKDNIFLFYSALSDYNSLLKDEDSLKDIVYLLMSMQICTKNKKISYLLNKSENDIKDMFLFVIETIGFWINSIEGTDIREFNSATIDLYNALTYFINTYFKYYDAYKRKDAQDQLNISANKTESREDISNSEEASKQTISAEEFFHDIELDYVTIEELRDLEDEIEEYLYKDSFDEVTRNASVRFLNGYIKLLNQFFEFKELAYALSLLRDRVSILDLNMDTVILMNLFKFTIKDLIDWKESVFINQNASDIHYIDQSFYANVTQIDMLFLDTEDDDNDIEFF